jgi:phosphomannomutase
LSLQISVSGIRGIVGESLDATVASQWAAAFGAWLPPGPVVIGRDTRPSGVMLAQAVAAALMSTGHAVWDIGIATTPTTEIAVAGSEAVGGVIITASHNPQPWNALKFLQADGLFLTAGQNQELRRCLARPGGHVGADRLGRVTGFEGAEGRHVQAVLKTPHLDTGRIGRRRFHVVVDAVEGAGGLILPRLLRTLGVVCTPLYCNMSGLFPHEPEPTPAHLGDLMQAVKDTGAALGLALDPDGDRLALVDGRGKALSEELTLVLATEAVLCHAPGPVVVNLSTTSLIDRVADRYGAPVLRTPVGEANVVEAMLREGAVIGGEGNGGVIYPAVHAGRDALVGAALILQLLAEREQSLEEIVDALPSMAMVKEKAPTAELPVGENLASVLSGLGPGILDERDGVKWTGERAWVHVRPSNTEPVTRIIAEAETEEMARRLIRRVRNAVPDSV